MSSGLAPALGGRLGEKLGGPLRASFVDSLELDHANWTDDLPAEFARRRGYELAPHLPFVLDADDPADDSPRAVDRASRPLRLPPDGGRALPGALPRHLRRLGARERPPRPHPGLRPRDARARRQPAGGPAGGRELALVGPRPDRGEPDRRQQVRLLGRAPRRALSGELRGDDERGARLPRDAGGLQARDGPERSRRRPPPRPPRLQLLAARGGLSRLGALRLVVLRAEPLVAAGPPLHRLRGPADHRPLVVGVPGERRAPRAEGGRVGARRPPVPALPRGLAALVPLPPLAGAAAGGIRDRLRERGRPARRAPRGWPAPLRLALLRHAPGDGRPLARAGDGRGDRALRRGGRPGRLRRALARSRARAEGRGGGRPARAGGRGAAAAARERDRPWSCPRRRRASCRPATPPAASCPTARAASSCGGCSPRCRGSASSPTWRSRRRTRTWASSTTARASGRSSSSPTRAGPTPGTSRCVFPTGDRRPWRWDLETGAREPVPFSGRPDTLALHLEPLESLLLVFEPTVIPTSSIPPGEEGSAIVSEASADPSSPGAARAPLGDKALRLGREPLPVVAPWDVDLRPAGGTPFRRRFPQLFDLSLAAGDPEVAGFGGIAVYRAEFDWTDETRTVLGLGTVHGVSAVRLNGQGPRRPLVGPAPLRRDGRSREGPQRPRGRGHDDPRQPHALAPGQPGGEGLGLVVPADSRRPRRPRAAHEAGGVESA